MYWKIMIIKADTQDYFDSYFNSAQNLHLSETIDLCWWLPAVHKFSCARCSVKKCLKVEQKIQIAAKNNFRIQNV